MQGLGGGDSHPEGAGGGEMKSNSGYASEFVVIKRSGHRQARDDRKIATRLRKLCFDLTSVDLDSIVVSTVSQLANCMHTSEIDMEAAKTAAARVPENPEYGKLAARLVLSNLYKQTPDRFSDAMEFLYACRVPQTGKWVPRVSDRLMEVVRKYRTRLDVTIRPNADDAWDHNDTLFDYFGLMTLMDSYLIKVGDKPVERPQYVWMRVALDMHGDDIERVLRTYELLSSFTATHATPTLLNAGTPRPQCGSCFLKHSPKDALEAKDGILDVHNECAVMSKYGGGLGLAVHDVRARGTLVAGTGGTSNGVAEMLKMVGGMLRYVDQGGGKRKGSVAVYIAPWHADFLEVLDLRRPDAKQDAVSASLNIGVWMPDLFMQRCVDDADWTFFSPDTAPGLADVWGEKFKELYERYEREGRAFGPRVKARAVLNHILERQTDSGQPYIVFSDAANAKSNQQNLGTITGSNLCAEILQFTSHEETAMCNLASINLRKFVRPQAAEAPQYDFEALARVAGEMTVNLNRIIDRTFYPTESTRASNLRHRPIGLGVQGLADVFLQLKLPFDCPQARALNRDIFEALYFGAMRASMELARDEGGPYASYQGSPLSQGKFQFDLWGAGPEHQPRLACLDWAGLRADVARHGVRNSLLIALMPTASTSQIQGNNECFEPYTRNVYTRKTKTGVFIVVNPHLVKDLMARGLWDEDRRIALQRANGSVQGMMDLPEDVRLLYRTAWEIPAQSLLEMSADRAPFVCQTQSLNLYHHRPVAWELRRAMFHAWRLGLKTGVYYSHTDTAINAPAMALGSLVRASSTPQEAKQDSSTEQGSSPVALDTLSRADSTTSSGAESPSAGPAVKRARAMSLVEEDDGQDCLMCGA